MKKKSVLRGLTSVTAMIAAIALGASVAAVNNAPVINEKLGFATSKLVLKEGVTDANGDGVIDENDVEKPQYFKSDFAKDVNNVTEEELAAKNAAVAAFVELEAEEGAVLLFNNGALPLEKGASVTLLGRSTVNPYYKGSSGGGSGGTLVSYLEALQDPERAGFKVNQTVVDAYSADSSPKRNATARIIGESPISVLTDEAKASFASYGDAAIVMFSREGAESNDLHTNDSEGISQLALHKDEKDLMDLVQQYKENGTFKKVIVLINSAHPMEVKWMADYDVDACMIVGGLGASTGFRGVSDLLVGNANPSGRLVDTYASNSLSAPATQNFGEYRYTNYVDVAKNSSDNANDCIYYVAQTEGIYVGYKYYETRYEDCILNRFGASSTAGVFDSKGAWNYAEEMSYPFGYGLSYTTFEQKLTSVTRNNDNTTTVKGTVKNTGSVPGKSVVEVYAQTPYGDYEIKNGVEKSAVQLVGFTKTDLIPAGQTVDFEVTFDNYFLASYDRNAAKTYILSEGDYYVAIGDNAHDALNNILAAKGATGLFDIDGTAVSGDASKTYKWNQASLDAETFRYSKSGYEITNQMDEVDLNYYQDGLITYLTRSDWEKTFPVKATELTAPANLITKLSEDTYVKPADAPSAVELTLGAKNGLTLADMYGIPYEDPLWNDFVDQLTLSELINITMDQGGIAASVSVSAPHSGNGDGPDGIAGNAYVNESLAAATWSTEILRQLGNFMGEDALLRHGPQEVWCPGNDTHRTPFGGRNYEYYSEDANLAYILTGAECAALEAKGVSAGPKHFFANDQETWRTGVATYSNEQAFREIQLRAFEGAFTVGGATSVMSSFNRVGPIWIGHYKNIQDNILRGEWGFTGFIITDAAGSNSYMHTVQALASGTDMWCYTSGTAAENRTRETNKAVTTDDDGNVVQILKEIAHRVYYTYAHTNMMNGLSSLYNVVPVTPTWIYGVYGLNAVLWAIPLILAIVYALKSKKKEA
ncbi:MAG: glycoside hydrolase family 3 C-terminal domain-containing protein [Lachnospiraceae bacterium]|nr:glycoside hydrolase family 3 C-terminal domain-containing protein [Lachnospiraceae bacterium]